MFLRKKPVGLLSAADMRANVQHSDSGGGSNMSSHAGSQGGREFFHDRQNTGGSDRDLSSGRDRENSEREGRGRGKSERGDRGRGKSEKGGRGKGNSERGGRGKGNSERGRERGKSERGGRGRGGKGSHMVSDRGSYGSSQRQESDYNQERDSYNGHQREVASSPQRNEGSSYMDQQRRKGTYGDGRGPSIDSRERGGAYRPGMGGGISLPDFPDRDKSFSQGKTSYIDSRERVGSYKRGEGRDKSFSQGKASYKDSRERVGSYEQRGPVGRSFPDFQRRDENTNRSRASYMQKQNRMEPYNQRERGRDFFMDSQRKRGFSQDESTYRLMGTTSSMDYGNIQNDPLFARPRGDFSLSMDRGRSGNRTFMDSHIGSNAPYMDSQRGFNAPRMDPQRGFNAPRMDPQRGFNAPRMDPQRGLNAPVMDSQRGYNAPVMDSQRGFNAPLMDSQREVNKPFMDQQRGVDKPFMDQQRGVDKPFMDQQRGIDKPFVDQERSGWREKPVTGVLSREEKEMALGILEQIIVKKKESDAIQKRQERERSSSRERHQEWESPSSHERHQEWETPSSRERHQEWETPSSRERRQEWEPSSSRKRHQEWEPSSSYERHQEWESPSSHELQQEWEPYPSQMVNVESQFQVRHLDSLEDDDELNDKINDLVRKRNFKAAAQLSKKVFRAQKKKLTNAAKKNLTSAAQLSNVKLRVGKRNFKMAQLSQELPLTNVKERIGKRTLEMPEDDYFDYEDFAPPNKVARSSVLSRLGPRINTQVPMEVYGPDLRNLEQDELENLIGSLQHYDTKLKPQVLHCNLCAPFQYVIRTYPSIAGYIRHHLTKEHIALEESYKNKNDATLKYLCIEAKLGYMRRHGNWDMSRKAGMCNLCHVPKGNRGKAHLKVAECLMYHEYTHPNNCCSEGQFNSRNEYFYHCFSVPHLRNEAHYREAEQASFYAQLAKAKLAVNEIHEGSITSKHLNFRDSLIAKEVEIFGEFGLMPIPRPVSQLIQFYGSNREKSRPKRPSQPFLNRNEVQYKCYDPSVSTGRYKVIFTTEFECKICGGKEVGRSKQSVLDHCASQEHYDNIFNKINEIREGKGYELFTKKEPISSQKDENNMDEDESTSSQTEEKNMDEEGSTSSQKEKNMDMNDEPCTEETEDTDYNDYVDVDIDLLYKKRRWHVLMKYGPWDNLIEHWKVQDLKERKNTGRKFRKQMPGRTAKHWKKMPKIKMSEEKRLQYRRKEPKWKKQQNKMLKTAMDDDGDDISVGKMEEEDE